MKKPLIFAKFTNTEILGEGGRILFALLATFLKSGYPVELFNNLKPEMLGKIGSKVLEYDHLTVVDKIPQYTEDKIYLYDQPISDDAQKPWLKLAKIKFDIFSSYRDSTPLLFPYPIHPVHVDRDCLARLTDYRQHPKSVRIFFSGDMKGYTKNHIHYPKPKLPRLEIVNILRQALFNKTLFLENTQELDQLFAESYLNQCLIIDSSKTWVDNRFWLNYLAKADFFLAPPGIVMPMCHNIIEAMAVGAIPVTNYPEWFNPNLEHLKTCIAFSGKQDLIDKVQLVLNLEDSQISALRENVINYYEEHLSPARFIRDFEAHNGHHMDILMITERYVAKNAKKLNRNSFILRGSTNSQSLRLQGFFDGLGNLINRMRS